MNGRGTRVIVFMQWHTWGGGGGLEFGNFSSLDNVETETFSFRDLLDESTVMLGDPRP